MRENEIAPRVFYTFREFKAMARLGSSLKLRDVNPVHTKDIRGNVVIPAQEVVFQLEKRGFLWREQRISTDTMITKVTEE